MMPLLLVKNFPGGAPPPPGFVPTDLFGLQGWYYQADVDYAAGTWTDRSGKVNNLVQATAGFRPVLQSSVPELNAKSTILADGSDDYIQTAALTSLAQPLTSLLVARQILWTSGDYLVDGSLDAMAIIQTSATPQINMSAGTSISLGTTLPINRFGLLAARFNGVASEGYQDGANKIVGNAGAGATTRFTLGASGTPGNYGNAEIAEYIVYSVGVGAYDRLQLNTYLSKYAIPTTFLPTSITGCQAWFKGDDLGAVDSAISSWTDQSGNGRNADQGTAGSRPTVKIGINGRKSAYFDGGDYLTLTSHLAASTAKTIFAVAFQTTNSAEQVIYADGSLKISSRITASDAWRAANNAVVNSTATMQDGWHSISAVQNGYASLKVYHDSVEKATGVAGTGGYGAAASEIGRDPTSAVQFITGYISELIVYNTTLTTSERQQVEGYLANKYAINAAIRPFDPLSVAGCKGWWRVDGGCDVNTDAASITTLYDRSGNGNHLTEATNKPTYETAELNTYAVARFDGVNDKLKAAAFTLVQPNTLFLVAKHLSTPGATEVWCDGNTANTGALQVTSGLVLQYNAGATVSGGSIAANGWNLVSANFNGASSKLRQDGVNTASGNPGAGNLGGFVLGCDGGSANFADVEIAEAVLYSGTLTDQDIASITSYLAARYAIGYKEPDDASIVANLAAWWDTSQEAYADAAAVTQLTDRSSNGRNLVTGTSPDFDWYVQNGRPSVKYTALNLDYLTNAAFVALDGVAAATFFSVTKNWTGGILFSPNGVKLQVEILAGNLVVTASTGNFGSVAVTGANPNIVSVVYNGAGAANADRLKVWVNGVAQTLAFTGTIPATLGTATGLDVGRAYGVGTYIDGDLQEIALYTAVLTDADRRAVENGLAQKYLITI